MDEKSLRKLIREEVEGVLDEADKAKKGPPTSFSDFRKQVAAALKKAKAPEGLSSEAGDVENEGGGVASALWSAWSNINEELKDAGAEAAAAWPDLVAFYVHDVVIDMADEFKNPMNYGPGAKKGEKPIDASALADAVVKIMSGDGKGKKGQKPENKEPIPTTFDEFRSMLGASLGAVAKKFNVSDEFLDTMTDKTFEGSEAALMHRVFTNINDEVKETFPTNTPRDNQETWQGLVSGDIHDLIIDLFDGEIQDPSGLAAAVVSDILKFVGP